MNKERNKQGSIFGGSTGEHISAASKFYQHEESPRPRAKTFSQVERRGLKHTNFSETPITPEKEGLYGHQSLEHTTQKRPVEQGESNGLGTNSRVERGGNFLPSIRKRIDGALRTSAVVVGMEATGLVLLDYWAKTMLAIEMSGGSALSMMGPSAVGILGGFLVLGGMLKTIYSFSKRKTRRRGNEITS